MSLRIQNAKIGQIKGENSIVLLDSLDPIELKDGLNQINLPQIISTN